MNFYNPYFYSAPIKSSLGLTKKFNLSSLINGTTKVLNLINQGIPIIKQTYPVIKNAKTMFSVLNEFKKAEPVSDKTITETENSTKPNEISTNNYPTFFI